MNSQPLSRRTFLQAASAFGLAAALPGQRKGFRVGVVGAGLSGLSTARTLADLGMSVVVFEAKSRIGGRICTENVFGSKLELGADRFYGDETMLPLAADLTKQGITWRDTNDGWMFVDDGGDKPEPREIEAARTAIKRAHALGIDAAEELRRKISFRELISMTKAGKMDRVLFRTLVSMDVEQAHGAGVDDLWSGAPILAATRHQQFVTSPSDWVNLLAKGLDIRLQEAVQGVTWDDATVTIDLEGGAEKFDAVVLTLPLGVLKEGRVSIGRGLPRGHQEALRTLQPGNIEKLFLRFKERQWEAGQQRMVYASGIPTCCTWFESVGDTSILAGFLTAGQAQQAVIDGLEKTVALSMQQLRAVLGNKLPDPVESRLTRWSLDPFVLGARSSVKVGYSTSIYGRLAEPVAERVFLAGEHTYQKAPGTLQGAYLSGLRAAAQVTQKLGA